MATRTNLYGKSQAVMGDKTSHGGAVISGSPTSFWHGVPIARKGDRTFCPRCKPHFFEISEGLSTCTDTAALNPMATEGHLTTCGASLVAESNSTEKLLAIMALIKKEGHDDCYVLRDSDGAAMPFTHYAVRTKEQAVEFAITDQEGHTHLHLTDDEASEIEIYIAG